MGRLAKTREHGTPAACSLVSLPAIFMKYTLEQAQKIVDLYWKLKIREIAKKSDGDYRQAEVLYEQEQAKFQADPAQTVFGYFQKLAKPSGLYIAGVPVEALGLL